MSYSPIQNSEILSGAVIDASLLLKIKNNFDAQQSELLDKQATIDEQAIKISKQVPIGTVRSTILTVAQYQGQVDGVWMLMNGQSCIGTEYANITGNSTVPDAATEGAFLRQAKVGRVNGSFENDAFQGHHHQIQDDLDGGSAQTFSHASGYQSFNGATHTMASARATTPLTDFVNGTPRTANETRPKNIGVNYLIKVGY